MGYPTTLINYGLAFAEKILLKKLQSHKKHSNEQPLSYISTYKKPTENYSQIYKRIYLKTLITLKTHWTPKKNH